jgi:large subunit ribosomal protein L15
MQLDSMKPAPGSRQPRKRLGRGPGSGLGKTSGKGHKGLLARSGGGNNPGFEGGQMPLSRRIPKHGFKNPSRVPFQVVNLSDLAARFEAGETVDHETLRERGLARRTLPVKILGNGSIDRALNVQVDAYSAAAKAAIEGAGGTAKTVAELADQSE